MRWAGWLLLAAVGSLGCRPRPVAADPQPCAPGTAAPDQSSSAGPLVGDYQVRLVATSGPRRGSSTDGTLSLFLPRPGAAPGRSVVLHGRGDLRLEEVGASSADISSGDPTRPGVVVLELAPRGGDSSAARILLRLGAEANRTDVVRLEGASTVLRVREVGDSGFAGDWTAYAPLPLAGGYFCAWRTPPAGP